jgi:hypothetical protein
VREREKRTNSVIYGYSMKPYTGIGYNRMDGLYRARTVTRNTGRAGFRTGRQCVDPVQGKAQANH